MYVVPAGVTSLSVELAGAQGASPSGGGTGGAGGVVTATLSVNPGEVLQLMVGGVPYNGGARGAGTGGGASDIRRPAFSTSASCAFSLSCALSARVVVAGGGGGGGSFGSAATGGAGGLSATAGSAANAAGGDAAGGGAGTSSAGGSAGSGTYTTSGQGASAGSQGSGGASAWVASSTGGGGGGGYYGGGGGGVSQDSAPTPAADGAGGGGGGSSWAGGAGVSGAAYADGSNTGNGYIRIDVASTIGNAAFGYTGTFASYSVPSLITKVYVRLYGGAGGGAGDVVYGQLPVTAGEVLQVNAGGRGWGASPDTGFTAAQGGWNGGGTGKLGAYASAGGGGGGATDIRRCASAAAGGCTTLERLVVAGGGAGGSEGSWGLSGGDGGAGASGNGGDGGNGGSSGQGYGATLTAPGAAGSGVSDATAGSGAVGGNSSTSAFAGGGGGGGGYFGGGGGNDKGGGGGSSYASVTGADPTGLGVGNVLGTAGAAFAHSRGGSYADGLAIITAMPLATTGLATGATTSGADVAGTINPEYFASRPTVYYSTSQATIDGGGGSAATLVDGNASSVLSGASVQSVSGSISGLAAGTTYYYRVCADSVAGSGCGTTLHFTTLPAGVTPPVLVTPTATAITDTTAAITGLITPGSESTTVRADCATDSGFASVTSAPLATQSPMTGLSSQSATFSCTGLAASTTYYVRTRATITISATTYTYISGTATFTTASASSGSSGGGGSGSPSPSATPSLSVGPSTTLAPIVAVPLATPPALGTSALVVNGVPAPVTLRTNEGRTAVQVSGSDFSMTLEGRGAGGQPLGLTAEGALVLESDRFATTSGSGFLSESRVRLYLFSTPRYVGEVLTNPDGTFSGTVQLPADVPPGLHTLQASGYTVDGQIRSLSLGVLVRDAGTHSSQVSRLSSKVHFRPLSSTLTAQARRALHRLTAKASSRPATVMIMGFVQPSDTTRNDMTLSTRRAKAVATYLRRHGVKGTFVYRGAGVGSSQGAAARKVVVRLEFRSGS
jgi:outer membrane protein OmpA-like peptidoglycan-associated protein